MQGNVEERSIVEPVRNLIVGKGKYYEAVAKHVDVERKQLVACFPADAGLDEACFQISYDVLVVAVGSVNNTFNIQVRHVVLEQRAARAPAGHSWRSAPGSACTPCRAGRGGARGLVR
jgi:hypothetical protein